MSGKINPVTLKGKDINERIMKLMGVTPIKEDSNSSVVELTKIGSDGKVYGIVRENHQYFIKISEKTKDLTVNDFEYIGGLKNKLDEAFNSYAKAVKRLNFKLNSLNEALNKNDIFNVLTDDNLINEGYYQADGDPLPSNEDDEISENKTKNNPWAICTSSVGRKDKEKYERCVKDVKKKEGIDESISEEEFEGLSEIEMEVEKMLESDTNRTISKDKKKLQENKQMSIEETIENIDDIIEYVINSSKKKSH